MDNREDGKTHEEAHGQAPKKTRLESSSWQRARYDRSLAQEGNRHLSLSVNSITRLLSTAAGLPAGNLPTVLSICITVAAACLPAHFSSQLQFRKTVHLTVRAFVSCDY